MHSQQATLFGIFAIIIWASGTLQVVLLQRIPVFQILIFSWVICFVFYGLVITKKQLWSGMKQPWSVWIIGTLGICLSHFLVVWALKLAPPAPTHVLTTLWPILIAWDLLVEGKQRTRYLLGVMIGFIGVCVVLLPDHSWHGQLKYWQGYVLAMISNFPWVIYNIYSRHHPNVPSEMIGLYSGIGAIFAIIFHLQFEHWVSPNTMEWSILVLKGLTASGIAYVWWEQGVKKGDLALLNVLYYFNPVMGVLLLILFGLSAPTMALLGGAILIVVASFVCSRRVGKIVG